MATSKKVCQGGIVAKINVFFFGTILWFEHWFHTDLCKIFWVYFCILYNKLRLLKNHGFPHFPINKMFYGSSGMGLNEARLVCKMLQHTSKKNLKMQ
jgi:hypothetical protein